MLGSKCLKDIWNSYKKVKYKHEVDFNQS
jgi:hypothetical protein